MRDTIHMANLVNFRENLVHVLNQRSKWNDCLQKQFIVQSEFSFSLEIEIFLKQLAKDQPKIIILLTILKQLEVGKSKEYEMISLIT